jgi:hypothetical protein
MIHIPATTSSPEIIFSETDHTLSIYGESYPENSFTLFEPLFEWLQNELPKYKKLSLKVNISYMNSSSTKCMLDILDILDNAFQEGTEVAVIWSCEKDNERALELAEEFREDLKLPFEIIETPAS